MIKAIIWLAGTVGFLWLLTFMGLWHVLAAALVCFTAACWIVGGAVLIGGAPKGPRPQAKAPAADVSALIAAARKAAEEQREKTAGK